MKPIEIKAINTLRLLSADEVQNANSGHPGMPLGAAAIVYTLFRKVMRHNPADPTWRNRDRFVLSGGHGSAVLYSILHLTGYDLPLDELKRFRQANSKTPGHPEYGHTIGVETTTGPLGQGFSTAVGFAIAEARLGAEFNTDENKIVDHYTYVECGDGDLMEGITSEAASLAGTLKLGKLIVLYDDNGISIEGDTDLSFTENVAERFRAYGWFVIELDDGNDVDRIEDAIERAKADERPALIVCKTVIGFGSPKAGMASAHGEPLGADALSETKIAFGFDPTKSFVVPDDVREFMDMRVQGRKWQADWESRLAEYGRGDAEKAARFEEWYATGLTEGVDNEGLWEFNGKAATRNSSGVVLNRLAKLLPNLIGGSADLAPSNKSDMKERGWFSAKDRSGSNIHFGVREHAMAAVANGLALHGGLRPYCATFFVFSDYMRGSIRLAALMKLPVVYVLTHDSIGVGEDGPTHQPVEQLDSLRAVPNLRVFRPADSRETAAGWLAALAGEAPTCLVLTRQDLPLYENSGKEAMRGGYVLADAGNGEPDAILIASGSEVEQMMDAQRLLKVEGVEARVVSMPCMELFEEQSEEYKESVLPKAVRVRVAMEAATGQTWYKYIGLDGKLIRMEGFGASAPAKLLFEKYGFTAQHAADTVKSLLGYARA
ncbi:MAG: transketolase [Oscillospiraceae bacterium]|jgi:transketolase|nr:transketolase [Oscillospiraceae bacterium]